MDGFRLVIIISERGGNYYLVGYLTRCCSITIHIVFRRLEGWWAPSGSTPPVFSLLVVFLCIRPSPI